MANLIKMDMRRLFHSKMFYISLGIVAALNVILMTIIPLFTKFFAVMQDVKITTLSEIIVEPFAISWMIILMFISMVSFSYADIANGFIKNIAGQIPRKSDTIVSKFIVVGIHNCVFILVAAVTMMIGQFLGSIFGTYQIVVDSQVGFAILTLLVKWMLSMAISSILLFLTTGVRNKTLASIVGVILGTGTMGLVYLGLNTAVNSIFKTSGFNLSLIMPDALIQTVNVGANTGVINAVIASIVCAAIFLALTIKVFNTRDIK